MSDAKEMELIASFAMRFTTLALKVEDVADELESLTTAPSDSYRAEMVKAVRGALALEIGMAALYAMRDNIRRLSKVMADYYVHIGAGNMLDNLDLK